MKKHHTLRAFTLIELLVVIVIIAALMGIAFPVFSSIQNQAKKTQAKNDLTQIVTAVSAYYTEYGKYPVTVTAPTTDAFFGGGTVPTGTTSYADNDVLIDVLRNNTTGPNNSANVVLLNPRGVAFLDVRPVKNNSSPSGGIIPNGASGLSVGDRIGVFYDPWGSPYRILIDTNYDNTLTNAYADTPGGTTLTGGVVTWSFGKNGALGGGDAVASRFTKEEGSPGNYAKSADVISWQ